MSEMWVTLLTYALQSCVESKLRKMKKSKLVSIQKGLATALEAVTSELERRT